ncbi:DNA polymerase III subunit beta [Pradoshia sp.]
MQISIQKDYFKQAVQEVMYAISNKPTIPILSGIKVAVDVNGVTLTGGNSDIVIQRVIPAIVEEEVIVQVYKEGSAVVPGKYFSEIIKKLPGDIFIEADEALHVTVQSKEIITTMNGYDPEEYPALPPMDESSIVMVPGGELVEMVKQTAFAAAKAESRPVLSGVHISVQGSELALVATNAQRLALRRTFVETEWESACIVPSKTLLDLAKLLQHSSSIKMAISDNYILFQSESLLLLSRLIEGNYPNIENLFPNEAKSVIASNRKNLLLGVDRASLFASEWRHNTISLAVKNGRQLKISSKSTAVGKIEEVQMIEMLDGEEELEIMLDGRYLLEALKAIKEEKVVLSFHGSIRPVLVQPFGDDKHLHLISPVRS